ncbi:MAG: hypothetical protein OXU26_11325 [Acidobacteriota bacterium]|nr:hypothetical protein [Acidobacteriota bacterium]MDE2964498.1 hypothetical protein [Acidobacteriota bacterium]
MKLSKTAKKRIIWAAVLVALLGLRVGWMLYDRSRPVTPKKTAAKKIERDYLVRLPRFYVSGFEEAKRLVGKPIWVKKAFQLPYYPVGRSGKPAAGGGGGLLPALEELVVKEVVEQPAPGRSGDRQVLAVFERQGMAMGTVIGTFDGKRQLYQMVLDPFFFAKDPRQLYSHWSENTWRLIRDHELASDMTFAQVALSIGDGRLVTQEAGNVQVYEFRRKPGGAPGRCRVRFKGGRVSEFKALE